MCSSGSGESVFVASSWEVIGSACTHSLPSVSCYARCEHSVVPLPPLPLPLRHTRWTKQPWCLIVVSCQTIINYTFPCALTFAKVRLHEARLTLTIGNSASLSWQQWLTWHIRAFTVLIDSIPQHMWVTCAYTPEPNFNIGQQSKHALEYCPFICSI